MARIRSVHPGFFTDEHFVSCSPFARLLAIGIWTECDDHGIFEWKPLTLKMRLMAADTVDIPSLLEELTAANLIVKFDHERRLFGAVRNFMRFQRPKKPKHIHFMPPELAPYVGLIATDSEPSGVEGDEVPPEFPTGGEKSPQREEGGWRGGGREDHSAFVPEPEREKEKQKLFEVVWKGFPKARTESRPVALGAFAELSIEEMRGFASSIASIAEDICKMKLDIPYNLAKFIRAKRFQGFQGCADASKTEFIVFDTPEWKSRVAAGHKPSLKTTERIGGRLVEGWRFPINDPGHERSLGAA